MKVLELFAGYGSQRLALNRLGVNAEYTISEIDKYALKAYEQLHGDCHNLGDIRDIKNVGYHDLWTYSFPCQDLSIAGRQLGISEDTRSGLLIQVERLLKNSVALNEQPKGLLLENVKALVSKKFMPDFKRWLDVLDSLGYNSYWQVLNAKDYGIPQNRERVFVVSILKGLDINEYKFPEKIPLEKRLKDLLETCVDEKYYLSSEKTEKFLKTSGVHEREVSTAVVSRYGTQLNRLTDIACTLNARDYKGFGNQATNGVIEPKVIQVGNVADANSWSNPQIGRVYSPDGCSPTLNTCGGGCHEPKITEGLRIRKLTPRECWRLMGVTDEEFNRLSGISNSQLYKLAGNSIVVNVLEGIFKPLLEIINARK